MMAADDLNHARILAGRLSVMDTYSSLPSEAAEVMLSLVQEVERLRRLVPPVAEIPCPILKSIRSPER